MAAGMPRGLGADGNGNGGEGGVALRTGKMWAAARLAAMARAVTTMAMSLRVAGTFVAW